MKTPILLLLLVLSMFSSLHAQDYPAANEPVSVEFMLYSWKCTVPELRYSVQSKTEALKEPFSTSKVQHYQGLPTLNFYAANARIDTHTDEPPKPLASVTFQSGAAKYVVLVVRASNDRYLMYAIPKEDSQLSPPYVRLYNFTSKQLAIAYDDQQIVQLAPRQDSVIRLKGKATVLRVARLEGERWLRAFNNVVELNEDGRRVIILAADQQREVSMFTLPPWPEKSEPDSVVMDAIQ
jgi:hypothetical protein